MDTKQKLETALKDAMRSNDATMKNVVRMALTNLKLAEVEKGGVLDDTAQLALIQKEIKMRQETMEEARKSNRADLIEKGEAEVKLLESFLPKQMSEDEVRELVNQVIAETGASSPADMGKVMKALMGRVQGKAPGDLVSRVVRESLQNR